MAHAVFISYSSHDREVAFRACTILEGAGIGCWIAPRDIRPGQQWASAIVDAIDACKVMVLIYSANTNASQDITREVARALSNNVAVIRVRLDKSKPSRGLAYYIESLQWVDALTEPLDIHLQALAKRIREQIGEEPKPPDWKDLAPTPALDPVAAPRPSPVAEAAKIAPIVEAVSAGLPEAAAGQPAPAPSVAPQPLPSPSAQKPSQPAGQTILIGLGAGLFLALVSAGVATAMLLDSTIPPILMIPFGFTVVSAGIGSFVAFQAAYGAFREHLSGKAGSGKG